jgi:aspartyl-tRNA(Asn)/glutamyl-tRNA(Gln) amidotransferase subunit A
VTAVDIAAAVRGGERSAREVVDEHLAAIAVRETEIHAFNLVTDDAARATADEIDRRVAAGDDPGPLAGVPIALKDNLCTRGVPTTCSSKILEGWRPPYDATVVARLTAAGAVAVGKTNLDEFAMGSSTENSAFGPTRNPHDTSRVPGGSSGGSAAAVAAGFAPLALGSDTGGSIRQPAAFTGIVGMKPTYGRCSRWGIIAFASSLDQAGPMARTVRDTAILMRAMAGHDPKDSTSADIPVPDYEAMLTGDIRGRVIGIPREYRMDGMPDEIERLWAEGRRMLEDAGAVIRDISLPHTKYALPAYYVIAPAEASSNLARYDGVRYGHRAALDQGDGIVDLYEKTRAEGFGAEVRRRIMVGTYVLSAGFYDAFYNRARKVRTLIKRDFETVFADGIDAILTPATPSAAFGLGEMADADPVQMYLNDVFTVTVNLAGLPGISVPAGLDSQGLPLGLQLIGRPWAEGDLLNAAYAMEQAAGFVAKPARWW